MADEVRSSGVTTPEDYVQINNMLSEFVRMVDRSINTPGGVHSNPVTPEQLAYFLVDDCVWEFQGEYPMTHNGLEEIANGFNSFHANFKASVHHYTNRMINTASGQLDWYSNAVWIHHDDTRESATGFYSAKIKACDGNHGIWQDDQYKNVR